MSQSTLFGAHHPPMRTPLPYYGAKVSMAKRIVAALPPHDAYVEPFCGSAAVFHELPVVPADVVLSDLNPWPLAALRAVRSHPEELLAVLPPEIDQDGWRRSVIDVRNDARTGDDVRDAVTMICAWWSAFNSSPWSGARSDRMCRQYAAAVASGKMRERVLAASARLSDALIIEADAIGQVDALSATGRLFFCDPPYMRMEHGGGSRGAAYGGYGPHEPPDRDWHERFLDAVAAGVDRGAAFVITSGKDELYEDRLGALGFGFLGGFGLEGRGPGRGGTATAKHLIWVSP